MEQDLRTCPSCGALSSDHPSCPYCGWTPDLSDEPNVDAIESIGSPAAASLPDDSSEPTDWTGEMLLDEAEPIETGSAQFRELLKPGSDPEHLLDQVPEEMRGVLAARLKAAEETDSPMFSDTTTARLRDRGFIVSEDVHGARLSAAPGQSADLSASDVVKLAADLDGGVQLQSKLPICSSCQAANPIGELQCQWCGEPFSDEQ